MKDSIKNRKNLLALCLSVLMFSSIGALAACKDDATTDSSTSETSSSSETTLVEKDDGLIRNGTFETYDPVKGLNTSVTGWSSTTDGKGSKHKSGIIDLSTEGWKNLTGSYYAEGSDQVKTLTEETAAEVWDNLTIKDKLTYYDYWKENNSGKTISDELDFYEVINHIDLDDIPNIAHFDTHDNAVANGGDATKVLMIHNQYEESDATHKAVGTAQKYTSSTVTLKAGTSAEFSVWVRTQDLQCEGTDGSVQDAINKGAYISVTHSVGGKTLDAFRVENINTNSTWVQYSFLLRGAAYADTTFNLVLGLGQGTANYRGEYVNGYAFFDDATCTVITNDGEAGYAGKVQEWQDDFGGDGTEYFTSVTDGGLLFTMKEQGEEKVVNAYLDDRTNFAFDFYGNFQKDTDFLGTEIFSASNLDIGATTTEVKLFDNGTQITKDYSSLAGSDPAPWVNEGNGYDGSADYIGTFSKLSDVAGDAKAGFLYEKYFKDDVKFANEETLLLLSQNGVAYEAKSTVDIVVKDYLVLSFFVKTSSMGGFTGAGVTLEYTLEGVETKTSFTSIDTTTNTPVEVDGEDIYQGWYQYVFFIENDTSADQTVHITFNFGPTSIEETTKDSHRHGFAAFTNFEMSKLEAEEFESAKSGSFAKVVTISHEEEDEAEGAGFDSAAATPSGDLERKGLANPKNYKGVYSDSAYVTGTIPAGLTATEKKYYTSINQNANAGLLNKQYFINKDGEFEGYFDNTGEGYAWLDGLKSLYTGTAEEVWNAAFGENTTQPLFIWNDGTKEEAYGFFGKSTSVAANSYAAVSVRVKGTTGSKAFIRLVDTASDSYTDNFTAFNQTMSVGRNLIYWYDDDGNICTGDPSKKATMIAFRLQPNGLYKVNKSCTDLYNALKAAGNENAYFANLSAYTETNANGDLLVGKKGASHDYSDAWDNEGMDGIAFYYGNGGYYADAARTIPVLNVASIDSTLLAPRYNAESAGNYKMEQEITLSSTEWTTVTFYIHTGDLAKSYRFELWGGDANGKTTTGSPSYVVFDYNNPGTADSNFTALLEEYETSDKVTSKLESVFSYFDTANYLRYNEDLDEKGNGNLYENNYTPSTYEDGIAFLRYEDTENGKRIYNVFADYQYAEKAVAAEAVEEEEEETEEEEEESDTNIWLLISSLSVAGVLLLAIGSIVIRKIVVSSRKKRAAQASVAKPKKAKKSKK